MFTLEEYRELLACKETLRAAAAAAQQPELDEGLAALEVELQRAREWLETAAEAAARDWTGPAAGGHCPGH